MQERINYTAYADVLIDAKVAEDKEIKNGEIFAMQHGPQVGYIPDVKKKLCRILKLWA